MLFQIRCRKNITSFFGVRYIYSCLYFFGVDDLKLPIEGQCDAFGKFLLVNLHFPKSCVLKG